MSLTLYNTLTRQCEAFVPLRPGKVGMYVCGMTVYDLCHIGHARMMMGFDVVQRWLRASGYAVTYVRNITDIDDKIIHRAVQRGIAIRTLTDAMVAEMHVDTARLGIEPPTLEPRATDYVPQMLEIISTLRDRGLAYRADDGDTNFSVRKFPGYGQLSGKSLDELRAGERVAVQFDKHDPFDFALWKAAKAGEPADAVWDSAALGHDFGPGRPGWHIECSAMSCATLGETFDIHGGGADLQFPHHENEIAQSQGASGKPPANVWMHNGFVRVDNEKMSKSLGNFFTIRDVLQKFDGETLRFFFLRTHYRSPFNFSDQGLDDARTALRRLYTALDGIDLPAENAAIDWDQPQAAAFKTAMDDDFNTPGALAVLFDLANEANRSQSAQAAALLRALASTLGVLQQAPRGFLQAGPGASGLDDAAIAQLIADRAAAKAGKNFAEADRIRQALLAQGVALKDSAAGTTWVRA